MDYRLYESVIVDRDIKKNIKNNYNTTNKKWKNDLLENEYENRKTPAETWVNDVLQESNISINKPYKVVEEKNWRATNNTICVKRNFQEDDEYLNKHILKHEVKHLINKDSEKAAVLSTATVGLATFTLKNKPILSIPVILFGYMTNLAYWRYYEGEADIFAYKHAVSRKEIEASEQHFTKMRESDLQDVVDLSDEIHRIENKLKNEDLSYYDALTEKTKMTFFKTIMTNPDVSVDILHFVNDPTHPLPKNRALAARQYLNKWDEEHK
jgi:hypothetical protein